MQGLFYFIACEIRPVMKYMLQYNQTNIYFIAPYISCVINAEIYFIAATVTRTLQSDSHVTDLILLLLLSTYIYSAKSRHAANALSRQSHCKQKCLQFMSECFD